MLWVSVWCLLMIKAVFWPNDCYLTASVYSSSVLKNTKRKQTKMMCLALSKLPSFSFAYHMMIQIYFLNQIYFLLHQLFWVPPHKERRSNRPSKKQKSANDEDANTPVLTWGLEAHFAPGWSCPCFHTVRDPARETVSLCAGPGLTLRSLHLPLEMKKYSFHSHGVAEGQ